jgi:hypothetical protein
VYINVHFQKIFFVEFLVQEEGESLMTLREFNTPQEESNKFEGQPCFVSSFHV